MSQFHTFHLNLPWLTLTNTLTAILYELKAKRRSFLIIIQENIANLYGVAEGTLGIEGSVVQADDAVFLTLIDGQLPTSLSTVTDYGSHPFSLVYHVRYGRLLRRAKSLSINGSIHGGKLGLRLRLGLRVLQNSPSSE